MDTSSPGRPTTNDIIVVRRHWRDWAKATVARSDFQDPHWRSQSGGAQVISPQPFIHGYISCTDIIDGGVSHSCSHGPPPHRIRVCFVQKDNKAQHIRELKAEADANKRKF